MTRKHLVYINPKMVYDAIPASLKRLGPWKRTQISKAERKGKTPQQIQQLRFEKWALSCHLEEFLTFAVRNIL